MRCLPSSSSSHTHSCVWWCVYLACVCVSSVVVSFPRLFWLVDGCLCLPSVCVLPGREGRRRREALDWPRSGIRAGSNGGREMGSPITTIPWTNLIKPGSNTVHTKHKFNAHAMEMWRVLSPWNTRVKLSFWCWKAVGRKKVGLARHVWRDPHAPDDRDRGMWG
jgi:hypothetical protein